MLVRSTETSVSLSFSAPSTSVFSCTPDPEKSSGSSTGTATTEEPKTLRGDFPLHLEELWSQEGRADHCYLFSFFFFLMSPATWTWICGGVAYIKSQISSWRIRKGYRREPEVPDRLWRGREVWKETLSSCLYTSGITPELCICGSDPQEHTSWYKMCPEILVGHYPSLRLANRWHLCGTHLNNIVKVLKSLMTSYEVKYILPSDPPMPLLDIYPKEINI